MIDETQLSFPRGTLVEFRLHLGGGTKTCRGLVLNTAVLMGKGARQVWILDMDDPTPQLEAQWTKKKFIVPEGDILCIIPSTVNASEKRSHSGRCWTGPVIHQSPAGKDAVGTLY